jgi:actin-like ATPase involved in cell morphogenesis
MTAPQPYRLGVDLGTSTTIAMLHWPDGRVRPLLFDGSPLLSSAVLLGLDGQFYTGRDAAHFARGNPERMEPNPKRRIDDDVVLLGDAEVPVRDLLAAVLRRVGVEARRVANTIGEVTLTHPAAWGGRRVSLLADAAEHAGLGRPRMLGEPEAAARYLASSMGGAVPLGGRVLVYDLGAGTCDLTLLRRTPVGFDLIATDGLNDVGGLDVDAAIVGFLEASYGQLWTDAVSRRQVWEDVRNAKEMLSRSSSTVIAIPSLSKEVPLGREQFDGLIGPVLRPTIAMTKALLRDATAGTDGETALVLVGGASRIPLVATMLNEALGIAPIVTEQPELVVAEGALYRLPDPATGPRSGPATGDAGPAAPVSGAFGQPTSPAAGTFGPRPGAFGSPAAPVSGGYGPPSGPVSGGFGPPSGPVSGGFGPSMPVSGGYGPAAPVSPGYMAGSPAAPVSGGYRPPVAPMPPTYTPRPAPQPGGYGAPVKPARRMRGLVVGAVVAVLVVAGAGTAAALWLSNGSKSDSTGGAGASSSAGQTPTSGTSPGKYKITLLPENLCDKVDPGPFATRFEKDLNAPSHQRNLSTIVGWDNCALSRQHGAEEVVGSFTFTAFVYTDTKFAVSAQQQVHDSAKLNDPALVVVHGIGDEAFVNRMPSNSATDATTAQYAMEVRDGNLRWTAYAIEARTNGVAWTTQERTQIVTDLEAAVKATHAKLTAA